MPTAPDKRDSVQRRVQQICKGHRISRRQRRGSSQGGRQARYQP